jgi:hypothetical protein
MGLWPGFLWQDTVTSSAAVLENLNFQSLAGCGGSWKAALCCVSLTHRAIDHLTDPGLQGQGLKRLLQRLGPARTQNLFSVDIDGDELANRKPPVSSAN